MRLTCCCFTCIIGNEKKDGKEEETNHLLAEEQKESFNSHAKLHSKPSHQSSYSRSFSAASTSSTIRGFSTESAEPALFESADEHSGAAREKFSKAVGVLKKYNVMSGKYNTKDFQRQLSLPAKLRLKVGIKMMPKSNIAKVSVIEAYNILEIVQRKDFPEMNSAADGEPPLIIQVRTKLLSSEVRGHTRKYDIQGSLTGALKFKSEPVHSIDLEEFFQCHIRFRLYWVIKHQRDKLLGEYILDVAKLNFDKESTQTHLMLEMYDPEVINPGVVVASPDILPLAQRMMSYDSQTSIDRSVSPTPKIQRQSKIHSIDTEGRLNLKIDEKTNLEEVTSEDGGHSPKSPFSKAFKSIRSSASSMLSKEAGSKDSSRSVSSEGEVSLMAEQMTANERLKQALRERSEKTEELEESTAAMASSASNLSNFSVKLKEKYKAEAGGKKTRSSES